MFQLALIDCRKFLASKLRLLDQRIAKGNPASLQEIDAVSDDEIIRKWLWIVSIIGGPSCFLVVPFVLSIVQPFIWAPLSTYLWVVAKCLMGLVFLIFLLAAIFTHKSSKF